MSTHLYPALNDFEKVKTWKSEEITCIDEIVVIPINDRDEHWMLAYVDFLSETIIHNDWFGHKKDKFMDNIYEKWVVNIINLKGKTAPIKKQWTFTNGITKGIQGNGTDCGVFTIMHAEHVVEGLNLNRIRQDDCHLYRMKIAHSILNSEIRAFKPLYRGIINRGKDW
jgi:Ulp1 family protease